MESKKVIVFDLDGTLFDTKRGIIKALNEVLSSFCIKSIDATDEDRWIGPPVRDSFKTFAGMTVEQAEEATKKYRKIYTEKYISESTLYEGLESVLKSFINKGYHLCIATMKTSEQVTKLLSIKNMTDDFEIIQTAAMDGSKTKSDMLAFIKHQYPEDCQFFMAGDTIGDLEAAEKNGYNFIGITYGYGLKPCNGKHENVKKIFDNI